MIERSLTAPAAFGAIFDRHFDAIHSYLARRIGTGRADDLAASTFAVAFERRQQFRREVSTARPWLFGIATNLLRNERRAEKRALEVLGRIRSATTPQDSADVDAPSALGEMLTRLDPDQRDALLLFAWEELSYEEIAAALGIPVGTVRSRLARARQHLRHGLTAGDERQPAQEANG